MFKKPFKVKSNNQIKSSERKNLKEAVSRNFPCLTDSDIDVILPKKDVAYCMKILTSENNVVLVYLVQKRPMFFEFNDVLYPTVYLLWKYSELLLTFTTTPFVVTKITNGADLMLPGVIANPSGYGPFTAQQSACINSSDNKSPIAVGVTMLSAHDLATAFNEARGKCVLVYHFYGDKLCSLEDLPVLPIPQLGPPNWLCFSLENKDDFPILGDDKKTTRNVENTHDNQLDVIIESTSDCSVTHPESDDNIVVDSIKEMDDLLVYCFLVAVKYSKTLELPILTSIFYKMEMMIACPVDKTLDVKKSSYKKVGQFLKHMTKEGIIDIKEKKKGIETIESINKNHPLFLNFYVAPECRLRKPTTTNTEDTVSPPSIVEKFIITNAVLPIFQEHGLKKGDTLQLPDVRKHVTTYVKNRNCINEADKRLVSPEDPTLRSICKNVRFITWEDLFEKVVLAMKPCFKVSTLNEETVLKGKIQSITMIVQMRGGNKKVTLVDNIELFGIRLAEFAKECQHGVAASTSISRPPGKKSDQLLIQGNQVLFIYNLLVEKYKIPKKYIKGLEFAPKNKK